MEKELFDVLVDKKKVEEIAALPTAEDVEKKLKKEGVNATPEVVKVLGNVFEAAANKVNEDELKEIGGGGLFGIDWKSKKARAAYAVITTALVGFGAYEADKHFNEGKGWDATKDLAGQGLEATKNVPGKVKGWFSRRGDAQA